MKVHLFPITVLLVIFSFVFVQTAGSAVGLPADFPDLVATQKGEPSPGVFIGWLGFWTIDYYVVLDQSGYPLFYSKTEQMSYPGVMFNGLITAPSDKGFTLKDETFTVVDSFKLAGNYSVDIHDFKVMPNGHALILGTYPINMDMSLVVTGGRPDAQLTGNVIQEIDTNKKVIFEWHAIDYIPITDSFYDLTSKSIDYAHFNSINIDPFDNNLLISFRTTGEITKVSRSTGEIIWRFGGKKNEFTFIGEHEENAPYYFVGQHSIWRKTNGNLLFFDNGNLQGAGTTPSDRTYSRAVEYQIDETNKTATLVWEFRHTPAIFTPSGGRVQPLSNGNVLIDWGAAIPNGAPAVPLVTEVSPAGEVVYELHYATAKKGSRLQKYIWNSPDLVKSQTFQNIISGNTYNSSNAGISVTVNSLEGVTNNGLAVKRHADAVRFPKFTGQVPQVLIDRVTISSFGIEDMSFDINFNIDGMDFKDPNQMTVYHRPQEDSGIFSPLLTYYDSGQKKLVVLNAQPGEFIFTYPDIQGIPIAPALKTPADMSTVGYTKPVTFEWAPKGLFSSFHLQVAKDSEFNEIVADKSNMTVYKYTMETIEPNTTYLWRVNTTNSGGTSDWANASFSAVAPKINVTVPNGGEQWQAGLTYFIQWNYNMDDNVIIELYSGGWFAKTIATVSGSQAYEWEADLSLRPGNNFYIKVKSASDNTIYDTSDASFSIIK
ncbi:MAG: aryl-sulfate sulfotransferase [Sedimentisphaerales bacterium]|nr:aryl-sulfate sulfotransferase [Sedimentisphaerales bacterium]